MRPFAALVAVTIALLAASACSSGEGELDPSNSPTANGDHRVTILGTGRNIGLYSSLALDAQGNPVISYGGVNGLSILHCNDPKCAGNDDSIASPDAEGELTEFTSLALDGAGNPVVSYNGGGLLKILHCNDPNCTGENESITTPDTSPFAGLFTSLVLDATGNPVVSYRDSDAGVLKILHCNDPNCAGANESITSQEASRDGGQHTSLALDAEGNPVVSYDESALKILHCNDPNCAGGDESITSPDPSSTFVEDTSLVLDGLGNPVVSYQLNGNLKLLHCGDANCAMENSIVSLASVGLFGRQTSLTLDAAGNPVVSYYDATNASLADATGGRLSLLHCNDPNCEGDGDRISSPDSMFSISLDQTSLALDASGYPVVSYYDGAILSLKLLRCEDPDCAD